jgi:hypothetical protein
VAEQRRGLATMDDAALEGALRDLAPALAYPPTPTGTADIAAAVRQRIVAAAPARERGGLLGWIGRRPIRRSLLVAVAALLILAAVAGAIGLGVPGIRIFFGGPTPTPTPAPTSRSPGPATPKPAPSNPLGIAIGLGTAVRLDEAARIAGLDFILPPDATLGPPDVAYILVNRAALVWGERPGLPADPETGVGLVLSEFHGNVDQSYYGKSLGEGSTVTPVTVNGKPGYWISGAQHFFYYVDPSGHDHDDSHRVVGDTLIWSDGDTTYRIESRLGKDDAIRLAESLR